MYKKSEEKGITLIALIITILVLLILTGISVATLSGDNGILTKANEAVQQNKIGTDKEAIILAYNAAMLANEGEAVTAEDLNDEFAINGVNATASGSDPITVVIGERTYTIGANGTITEVEAGEDVGPTIVEGTREDWEVTADGTITLFKGTVPADGTLVIPNVVDGIEIKSIRSDNNMSVIYDADVFVSESIYSDKVKKIIISEGIEDIGEASFAYAASLDSVTIPSSVATIGLNAFVGCTKLSTVNYTGTQDEWNDITINLFNDSLTDANIVYNYGK